MTKRDERGAEIASMRLWVAAILFVISFGVVVPAQTYDLWKASIAVTEWGHFVAIAALLLVIIPGWGRTVRGQLSAALAVMAFCLSISPLARAMLLERQLGKRLTSAFGASSTVSSNVALARNAPVKLESLFRRPGKDGVTVTTLNYAKRDDKPLQLDVYRVPSDSVTKPLVITIHGGSWESGSMKDLPELNYYLASRGYVVAAVSYRFAPANPFPAQTEDVNAAIDYLKAHAAAIHADPSRIVLVGRSAGGQLALQSAYTKHDPSIRGVAALYAPTDQKWGWDHPSNPRVYDSWATLRSFMHGEPVQVPDAYRESSAINHIEPNTVPTLLLHGRMDPLVSVRQSARLDSALAAAGRPHLFIEMPWATHGCDYVFNGPCGQVSSYAIERFAAAVTSPQVAVRR